MAMSNMMIMANVMRLADLPKESKVSFMEQNPEMCSAGVVDAAMTMASGPLVAPESKRRLLLGAEWIAWHIGDSQRQTWAHEAYERA